METSVESSGTAGVAPVGTASYVDRRAWLQRYFDRTAADAWAKLTSDAPVSGVRQKVRMGRAQMAELLLGWLPSNLTGRRVLDAGCGTGLLAVELARRGADVCAIDLSPTLVELAKQRLGDSQLRGRIDFRSGDMLDEALGTFDHVVAMDSLIHYDAHDIAGALGRLADRTRSSMVVTFAPRTPVLATMHALGGLFPRRDRAPRIVPVAPGTLQRQIRSHAACSDWAWQRTQRVATGFYVSQGLELVRGGATQ
jgi:magnesium-protoporphyrin O-methyltransferase